MGHDGDERDVLYCGTPVPFPSRPIPYEIYFRHNGSVQALENLLRRVIPLVVRPDRRLQLNVATTFEAGELVDDNISEVETSHAGGRKRKDYLHLSIPLPALPPPLLHLIRLDFSETSWRRRHCCKRTF